MFTRYAIRFLVSLGVILCLFAPAAAQCPPAAPGGVTASNGTYCTHVAIDWNSVSGATAYQVYRHTSNNYGASSLIATVPIPATSASDVTAQTGVTYFYWVRATNVICLPPNNSGPPGGPNQGWKAGAPPTPANLDASDTLCAAIDVTWDAVSGSNPVYKVYRNTQNNYPNSSLVGTTPATYWEDLTAASGTTHYYWVVAATACGASSPSSMDTGYRGPPPAPTDLVASDGVLCAGVEVSWSGTAVSAPVYQIWRNTWNNYPSSSLVGTTVAWTWLDVSALEGTTYYYWVLASTTCGASQPSNMDTGYKGGAPVTPTSVTASQGTTCSGVEVNWLGSPVSFPVYEIYRNTANNYPNSGLVGTTVAWTWLDVSAQEGTTYYYWVLASTTCGSSQPTSPVTGYRGTVPTAPTDLQASDGTECGGVWVTWSTAGNPLIVLYRGTENNSGSASQLFVGPTGSDYVDTTAVPGTTYYYWATATGLCGTSGFSNGDSGFLNATLAITQQPAGVSVHQGQLAVFTVAAGAGTGERFYQWRRNGDPLSNGGAISGAGTAQLSINPVAAGHAGGYDVVITDDCGEVTSESASLTVLCYADCNGDSMINIADFGCFQTKFAIGNAYADCNGDGMLNLADFGCFQTKFAVGCP